MSPLLRALVYSRATHEPVVQAMLLQAYAALDAFARGHGSPELYITLGRHLLVSEELCRLGHHSNRLSKVKLAHAAMAYFDFAEHHGNGIAIGEHEYVRLCVAFDALSAQLSAASLGDIAKAEAKMAEGLGRVVEHPVVAEVE